MNLGVILLIILIIILTIGITIALIYVSIEESRNNNNNSGNVILPPCSESTNISSLIQIPNIGSDCLQNGTAGSLYYIGNIENSKYDYVVAPWTTQPFDVCIGFCSGYTGNTCSGPNYNGKSAQDNFNNCMQQLGVTGCAPPLPVAAKGTTLYYPFTPTCNVCDNCARMLGIEF